MSAKLLALLSWLLLTTAAIAEEPDHLELGLATYCQSVSFAVAVATGSEIPTELLDEAGVIVWQQPGVALVADFRLTAESDSDSLEYARHHCSKFLQNAHKLSCDEPVQYPGEPENSDEFYLEPAVYLLEEPAAGQRLTRYLENYEYWVELNPGMVALEVTAAEQEPCFAVVFIDSSGPTEFYFVQVDGALVLRHFLYFDFFSA